jgi:hypothetical protein
MCAPIGSPVPRRWAVFVRSSLIAVSTDEHQVEALHAWKSGTAIRGLTFHNSRFASDLRPCCPSSPS